MKAPLAADEADEAGAADAAADAGAVELAGAAEDGDAAEPAADAAGATEAAGGLATGLALALPPQAASAIVSAKPTPASGLDNVVNVRTGYVLSFIVNQVDNARVRELRSVHCYPSRALKVEA